MKKTLALLTAAILFGCCSGCCKETSEPLPIIETTPPGATMEVSLSHSYAGKPLDTGDIKWFQDCVSFGDKILAKGYTGDKFCPVLFDPDTEELRKTSVGDSSSIAGIDIADDKIDVMLVSHNEDYTGFRLELVTYDSSLNELQRGDVTEAWGNPSEPGSWARDAQGNSYLRSFAVGILLLKPDGTLHTIEGTDETETQFRGRDGRVYSIPGHQDSSVAVYNPDTLKKENINITLPRYGFNKTFILPGNAQYDFLCYNDVYVYGVTVEDGNVTELMNWDESDFKSICGDTVFLLPDGRIMLYEHEEKTNWLLTPRTQEEMDSLKLISFATTYGSSSGSWVLDKVRLYNRQAEGHRITIKRYNDGQIDDQKGLEDDLLNGIVPDILSADVSNYQALSNKGLFEDLSVWMENDPDFHEEDYLMNFFDSMRYKGRLERMAFYFSISAWMMKTEFAGLSAPEYAGMPDGMSLLGGMDRNTALEKIVYYQLGNFVDYDSGTCRFDTPQFTELLEQLNTLPAHTGVEDEYALEENRALLYHSHLYNLQLYHAIVQTTFGNADVTLTGAPFGTEGNGGTFSPGTEIMMSSASAYKEEIWAFIKFCLNEENQMPKDAVEIFPVRTDALTATLEFAQQSEENSTSYMTYGGKSVELMPATAKEADKLLAYIRGITLSDYTDIAVRNIVSEEAGKYFAGDCTAAEAVNVIQSRASLYLAEQS